ncbi:MAG: carbamoyl-phosphate synthase (glutamine-hydrolyzing) large subunit [Deltaproteobacteria bacterium]|nr:MAG: carbamoyl-phosphate synthase (glutamine-hydrolyzing) large subunit [Deltaproteobacteria bacterium]
MSKKYSKVIILGSAALKIGEAGEFDYSGSQAIKALREEGIQSILINPNIATIQTSENLADRVYFLPVRPDFVEQVIAKEKPDGILLSFGGQTALNCGLELDRMGVFEKYNVEVLGTPVETVNETEDRDLFAQKLHKIGAKTPRSRAATSVEEALAIAEELSYPVIVRIAFALGGLGSGVCYNQEEMEARASKALSYTEQILVEEYLEGWKEIEYEVVRDRYDNCITVCNMENFDPMGIHTGESIVVAPSQTLTNRDYHYLRKVSIEVIRHLGVVGECNIQFGYDPHAEDYRIIEVNARLSRSSALASKATGYPLAFVAAKLALGYGLHELKNAMTQVTKAFFEPALDYIVVKMPRWDMKKFNMVSRQLGSGMKSVGEVMAIGRSFEESLQKAIRMLEIGAKGLSANNPELFHFDPDDLKEEIANPTEERIFAIAQALREGHTVEEIHQWCHIDRWFLYKLQHIIDVEKAVEKHKQEELPKPLLQEAKKAGFSDEQLASLTGVTADNIWDQRDKHNLHPCIRQIDTLAAEYPAQSNYLYLSYHGQQDDVDLNLDPTVLILGSGAYRIGSSVEFDWCCVTAGQTLRKLGYHTAMLNYNPETVSTDYDECDLLFFDEISFENVKEINRRLNPEGVIISMGGQIPNNLALRLYQADIPILGTSPEDIDRAENRHKFSSLLDELHIDQPAWKELNTLEEVEEFADDVGYPVLIRPSYVLSGAAMAVASNPSELHKFLERAEMISPEHPTVVSKFLENAKEIEFDAVARNGEIIQYAISEHVENAGVHSGDATLVLPPQRTYLETIRQVRRISKKIAQALKIHGPFNIQYIAKHNAVKVIECNLRASRSFPFVSKIMKRNFIETAVRIMVNKPVEVQENSLFELDYVGVKAPQFSFTRLAGADPTLGVEMASTGEVACLGDNFYEAFLKSLLSVGYKRKIESILFSTGPLESKAELLGAKHLLANMGIKCYATQGTATFMISHGIPVELLHWPLEQKSPNIVDYLKEGKIDLVINIPKNYQEEELTNDYIIRRTAVDYAVPLITNRQIAQRFAEALDRVPDEDMLLKSWDEYAPPQIQGSGEFWSSQS